MYIGMYATDITFIDIMIVIVIIIINSNKVSCY